jgi:hypothetical protein
VKRVGAVLAAAVSVCGSIGCFDASESRGNSLPPVTTADAGATTTVATTTVAPTLAPSTTLAVTTGIVLPPDVGRLVPAAPGVSTPGDIWQLAPKLWLFLPSDSAGDPHLTPPRPEDAEVLIAYARKQRALQLAVASPPVDLDTDELRSVYTPAGLDARRSAVAAIVEAGQYLELAGGIVYRPRVLSEPRTTDAAVVWDCAVDESYLVHRDGSPVSAPAPRGTLLGVFADLRVTGGDWRVELDGPEELACVG